MLGCKVFGHRYRFTAHGSLMVWECERGCGAGGSKEYGSTAEASRFAAAFDREDSSDLGKRAPFLGLFPLRIWRALRRSGRS